jgi:hypothetical protein
MELGDAACRTAAAAMYACAAHTTPCDTALAAADGSMHQQLHQPCPVHTYTFQGFKLVWATSHAWVFTTTWLCTVCAQHA